MKRLLKRFFDLAITVPALVLLSPLLVITSVLIRSRLGRPILFKQLRPGLHGRPFAMFKFRTMQDLRDSVGNLLPDEERMTSLGHFLRSTSLDELPQLFNVLKGDIGLVGPRPLLLEYLDRYTTEQARRHEVKPGVTGWAQVNGRNSLTWEEKFALDVWYVDNWNLWLDLRILWLTLVRVCRREGISAEGHATMPLFTGPRKQN